MVAEAFSACSASCPSRCTKLGSFCLEFRTLRAETDAGSAGLLETRLVLSDSFAKAIGEIVAAIVRRKLVSFRLGRDEYEAVKAAFEETDARSLSDFLRDAVMHRVQSNRLTALSTEEKDAQLEALSSALNDVSLRISRVLGRSSARHLNGPATLPPAAHESGQMGQMGESSELT